MKAAVARELSRPIRVLVVDDEPLFVEMVQAMLDAEAEIEVVGKAGHGLDAVRLAGALGPDVVVMDISMPVMDGIEATRRIRDENPTASILILTGGANVAEIDRARKAGAAGYLTKDRIASDLIRELRAVAAR
jgi:DNA-binding NarL/FixJ family response regulator